LQAVDWLTSQVTWLAFAAMVLLLFVLVVGRYIFGFSPVWAVELSQYCFVWLSFLAISLGYRKGAHISLDFLMHRAPPPLLHGIRAVAHGSTFVVASFMIGGGLELVRVFGATHSAGGVPMAWVYASPVIGGCLLCIFSAESFVVAVRSLIASRANETR
jgi:TRAP-type C4-dicarboxylate transport system permease small subunit